jgi:hypothetical protein
MWRTTEFDEQHQRRRPAPNNIDSGGGGRRPLAQAIRTAGTARSRYPANVDGDSSEIEYRTGYRNKQI